MQNMIKDLDVSPLFRLHGLTTGPVTIRMTEAMSGLEANPKDDWLHVALDAMLRVAKEITPHRMAIIGTGNGIDAIAAARTFGSLHELVLTDIMSDVLPDVLATFRANGPPASLSVSTKGGRDCEPLDGEFDVIYGNLPLVVATDEDLCAVRATTTLASERSYARLGLSDSDPLVKYSLLPQLGFLRSAARHLSPRGRVITLIGGRIPDAVVAECFERAGLVHRTINLAYMCQSDPEFIEQYAAHERRYGGPFEFYENARAVELLATRGIAAPSIVDHFTTEQLRRFLVPARIDAARAYRVAKNGDRVGHLALGYLAERRS
jgi:methylase of polypeptide subunit release factors